MEVSVIAPILNEEISLGKTLIVIKRFENVGEITVVDGRGENYNFWH